MIQLITLRQLKAGLDGAGFGIRRSINDFLDPGMEHGAHAHNAWLDRDNKDRTWKPVIHAVMSSLAQGKDFGMRGRIMLVNWIVAAPAYDFLI